MTKQITSLTKTHVTITARSGKEFKFSLKNQKQLRDAVELLNDPAEYLPLVKQYGDEALKTAYRVNTKGKKQAAESRAYSKSLRSVKGQQETARLEREMTSQHDFMPALGDVLMGLR